MYFYGRLIYIMAIYYFNFLQSRFNLLNFTGYLLSAAESMYSYCCYKHVFAYLEKEGPMFSRDIAVGKHGIDVCYWHQNMCSAEEHFLNMFCDDYKSWRNISSLMVVVMTQWFFKSCHNNSLSLKCLLPH